MERALRSHGVKVGSTVALCSLSTSETIIVFCALNKIGATIASVDPRKPTREVGAYMKEVDPDLILMLDAFLPKYKVLDMLYEKCVAVPLNANCSGESLGGESWEELLSHALKGTVALEVPKARVVDDVAVLLHTSGTTGFPKRVMLTDGNFNAIAVQYKEVFRFERQKNVSEHHPVLSLLRFGHHTHLPLCAG